MRITCDRQADAAYVYLRELEPAGVARMMAIETGGPILHLDFDAAGLLVGIEAIPASALLPAELLTAAVDPDVHADAKLAMN
jgi:uncharacterized protein YuzE